MNQCATSSTSFLLLPQINPTQTSAEGLILHLRQASRSLLNDGMFNQQIPQSDIWWSTIQSAKCSFHGPNVLAATQTRLFIKEKKFAIPSSLNPGDDILSAIQPRYVAMLSRNKALDQ